MKSARRKLNDCIYKHTNVVNFTEEGKTKEVFSKK